MPPSHEQDRADLQRAIDALPNGGTLRLLPREYPGPLVISHSLMLDGNGSTIWAPRGPVVFCQASRVVLRDLRVEVTTDETSETEDHCALKVNSGASISVENVEVRGSVIGLSQEEGDWRYPHTLQLGSVPFGIEHDLIIRLWVPVPCQISSRISGLEVQPQHLDPGTNEVTLHVERIGKDTLLSGTLYISTPQLKRSIVVNGHVSKTGPKKSRAKKPAQIIWQPSDWEALVAMPRPIYQAPLPPPPPLSPNPSEVIYGAPTPPPQTVNSIPPEQLSEPSGPSIQWPPPAPVIPEHQPLAQPTAPVPSIPPTPQPAAPPSPAPLTGGSPVVSPPASSVAVAPRSGAVAGPSLSWLRRPVVIVGIVIGLVFLALGGWWIFSSGPIRIDYERVAFAWSGIAGDEMRAVAFSADSSLLAGAGKDGVIRIWEASTGSLKREIKGVDPSSLSEISSLAFSPDGTMLVSGRADSNVILWDPQTGKQIISLKGHTDRVNAVAFSSDGKLVASGGDDGKVKLWTPGSIGVQPKTFDLGVPVKAVGFSQDGKMVVGAGGSEKGYLKIWTTADAGSPVAERKRDGVITSVAFSTDGKFVGGIADSTVVVWKLETDVPVTTFRGHKSQVNTVAFSPLGESIVSGGADNQILLWATDTYGGSKRQLVENSAPVYAVSISPNGRLIASAGADKSVKVWANK